VPRNFDRNYIYSIQIITIFYIILGSFCHTSMSLYL
jgi:hypothetical protein